VEFVDAISWGVDDTISMRWIAYLNIDIDQLAFELGANTFWARYKDHIIFEFFYY
jgi:hypothetical protein